jgi:hypothetical protein
VAIDDGRALAQFFAVFPPALHFETVAYVPQGEGQEPHPVFTSGLAMIKYGMWAEDHAVGTTAEARALVQLGLEYESALRVFPQMKTRFPQLETPEELTIFMVGAKEMDIALSPAVLRLLGRPPFEGDTATLADEDEL